MEFINPDISVLQSKKLFIFDMDGTIYLGAKVFPFAIRFIKDLRAHGKQVLLHQQRLPLPRILHGQADPSRL